MNDPAEINIVETLRFQSYACWNGTTPSEQWDRDDARLTPFATWLREQMQVFAIEKKIDPLSPAWLDATTASGPFDTWLQEKLDARLENPPCWCGEENPHMDDSVYEGTCGGLGTLYCECGGEQCVCHNHGEVECPGCEDCQDADELDDDPDDGFEDAVTAPDFVVGEGAEE
jgi:hypothetical protein